MSAAVAPVLAMDGLFKAFGGVVATRDLFGGTPVGQLGDWFRLLVIFDLVFIAGGVTLLPTLLAD